jgi:hypothetical protein
MNKPSFSIVIPTYGRGDLLVAALRSIEAQTYPPAEVIVVDDFSPIPVPLPTDLSVPVKVLRHLRNQGSGAARNTGLAHATADWVLFLDDDDLLTARRLEMAVEDMGSARCHAAAMEYFLPDGRTIPGKKFEGDLRGVFLDGSHPLGRHPAMGQVVHHREDLLQFDPTLRRSEDTEWWLRLTDTAVFAWTPEIGLRMRVHPEARPHSSPPERLAVRREIARRHGPAGSKTRRAHLYGQVSGAALVAGRRGTALFWSGRALLARPSAINAKRMAMAFSPKRPTRSTDNVRTAP